MTDLIKGQTRNELEKRLAEVRREMAASLGSLPIKERPERLNLAADDFDFFCITYLPHYFSLRPAEFHGEIRAAVDAERYVDGVQGRNLVGVQAPRGFAKSTVITFADVLHKALFKKRNYIIVCSMTGDLATDEHLALIKLELEENGRIKADFGRQKRRGTKWRDDDMVTALGVRIRARGYNERMRGTKHRSYRPDHVVIDDYEDDEMQHNPRRVKKMLAYIKEAIIPATDKTASVVMMGNYLSTRSVLSRIMAEDSWKPLSYAAITEEGESLWPESHSVKELEIIKNDIGTIAFNKEYMGHPPDDEGDFRSEWIEKNRYEKDEIAGKELEVYMGVDASVLHSQKADFKAIVAVGLDRYSMIYYVLAAWIRRATIDEMIRTHYRFSDEYGSLRDGLETNGFQVLLLRDYDRYAGERGRHLPIEEINHSTNKIARIKRLSSGVERGKLRFPKAKDPDTELLIEQLLYLDEPAVEDDEPAVEDDGPDGLEMAMEVAEAGSYLHGPVATRSTRRAGKITGGY